MNQNDTRAALEAAARSTYNAYWDVKDAALKQHVWTRDQDVGTEMPTSLMWEDGTPAILLEGLALIDRTRTMIENVFPLAPMR